MNEPGNPDTEAFESQLRRLVPRSHQELTDRTEETFYLAGWAAAEKHFAILNSTQPSTSPQITPSRSGSGVSNSEKVHYANHRERFQTWRDRTLTFSSGLAAGLAIWIGMSSFSHPQPSEITRNPNPPSEIPSSGSASHMTDSLLPQVVESGRLDDHPIDGSLDLDSAMRPALSRAALLHWRMASTSRQSSQVPDNQTHASPAARNVLRASPLNRDELTDFL